MPAATWKEYKVEELVAKRPYAISMGPFGSRITKDNFVSSGVPVIRGVNLSQGRFHPEDFVFLTEEKADELLSSNAYPDDLVFTHRGTLGQVGIIPRGLYPRYVASQSQMRVAFNASIVSAMFMFYYFSSTGKTELLKHISGSGVPAIASPLITLKNLRVRIPSLPIQQKIAAILSAYDDLIENNLRRIKILEEMAQNFYREWIVKFRFPGHQKVKMVDSPLGKIPEGWEVKRLGEAVELAYGKGLKEQDRIPGEVPVFGSSGVVGYHNQSLVNGPGIIVGRKGNVGSVHWTDDPFFPIDTVFYVVTGLPLHYVYFNLQTQNFISGDAAVPGLNRNQAYSLPFIIPKSDMLQSFSGIIEPIFNLLNLLKKRNKLLRQTRDLLLPKLISGELDVSELDIKIPDEASRD